MRWLAALIGFGPQASGVMTPGGTASNLLALFLARQRAAREAGWDPCEDGIGSHADNWKIVTSVGAHFSVSRAAAVLGLGRRSIHSGRGRPVRPDLRGCRSARPSRDRAQQQQRRCPGARGRRRRRRRRGAAAAAVAAPGPWQRRHAESPPPPRRRPPPCRCAVPPPPPPPAAPPCAGQAACAVAAVPVAAAGKGKCA